MSIEHEEIGPCTLYRADCRDVLDGLSGMDVIITDMPYGVELISKTTKKRHVPASILYHDTHDAALGLIASVMGWRARLNLRAVIISGNRMLFAYPVPTSIGCIFTPNGAGVEPWGFTCFHPILYYGKCPYLAHGKGSLPNGFASSHPGMHVTKEEWDHPCPKPLAWMRWIVKRGSLPGEVVCDPCMGTGTTGIACIEQGRRFVGIEIEAHYFQIACQRLTDALRQLDMFVEPTISARQEKLFSAKKVTP